MRANGKTGPEVRLFAFISAVYFLSAAEGIFKGFAAGGIEAFIAGVQLACAAAGAAGAIAAFGDRMKLFRLLTLPAILITGIQVETAGAHFVFESLLRLPLSYNFSPDEANPLRLGVNVAAAALFGIIASITREAGGLPLGEWKKKKQKKEEEENTPTFPPMPKDMNM